MKLVFPDVTGALCAKMNRGLSGQEAANGMVLILSNSELTSTYRGGVSSTLAARDYKSATDIVVEREPRKYIVRRLTPTECARLQGFPDDWCEVLGRSDTAIYKAYGNSLAIPCAYDVLSRIADAITKTTENEPNKEE